MYVLLVELLLVKSNSKDLVVFAVSFIVLALILICLTFFSLFSPLYIFIRFVLTPLSYCFNLTLYLTLLIFSNQDLTLFYLLLWCIYFEHFTIYFRCMAVGTIILFVLWQLFSASFFAHCYNFSTGLFM